MASQYHSVVKSLYLAYCGRPADADGLAYWSQQLELNNGDLRIVASAFSASVEAKERFAASDATTRITTLYQELFGRAPDKAGLDFWINAINRGRATIDDVAVRIINGAQGADRALSTLRQQAADQFSAELEAAGGDYAGKAAADTGRALIQAVNPNSSPADIAAMSKSAALLADIASRTPAVIEALGIGTNLAALFSTARGKAEPVELMHALADLAKTAAGDPATLDALLQGGGMAKVLETMPSGTSLHDLVGALGRGGLPAAVEVVYPPAPAPDLPLAGTLKFIDLAGGSGNSLPFTNNAMPMVELSGHDSGTTITYQVSRDGTTWSSPQNIGTQTDGTYYYRAIVTDAAGYWSASNVIGAILDRTAPVPSGLSLGPTDQQLALGESLTLQVKFSETVRIDPAAAPALVLNNGGTAVYQSGEGTDTLVFTYTPAANEHTGALAAAATGALQGRIVDRAGNAVAATALDGLALSEQVAVDTQAPQQTLTVRAVDQRDGLSADAVPSTPLATNMATTVLHATLSAALNAGEYVEYSIDDGKTWEPTHASVDGLKVTVSGIATAAAPTVVLRVKDAAGNHGAAVSQAIAYDGEAPTVGGFTLESITHGAADSAPGDGLTNAATADVKFGFTGTLAAGETLQYSTNATAWTDIGPDSGGQSLTIRGLNLAAGTPAAGGRLETTVMLRAVDSAGNAGTPSSTTLAYDGHADAPGVALVSDTGGSGNDRVSSNAGLSVTGLEDGAKLEYSRDGLGGWSDTAPEPMQGMNTVHVRQVDVAGNLSDAASIAFLYDSFAPGAPGVALLTDTGSDSQDRVTSIGTVRVGGLEHGNGTVWEYSTDGASWQAGTPVDNTGYATLNLSGDGPKTLRVRQTDLAGHTSDEGTLSFTLDTTAPAGVRFAQVEGAQVGAPNVTSLSSADVIFAFDGALSESDKVQYRLGTGSWVDVDGTSAATDANAGTVTIRDLGLGASDPTVSVRIFDQAGNERSASQKIDGPYQDLQYTATATAGGLQVTSNAPANAYVGSSTAALTSTLGGGVVAGTTTFGVQGTLREGTLSVGTDQASALADPAGIKYALGTNASETLTGQYVWGFGGRDTLVGTSGNDFLYGGPEGRSTFRGGLGSDTMTVQGTHNVLSYANAMESHVTGGSGTATGFDTVFAPDLGFAPNYYQVAVSVPIGFQGFTPILDIAPANGSGDALLAAFNAALPQQFVNVAMLFAVDATTHYLVVTNNDGVLDSGDYAIKIVGRIYDYGIDFDTNTILVGLGY